MGIKIQIEMREIAILSMFLLNLKCLGAFGYRSTVARRVSSRKYFSSVASSSSDRGSSSSNSFSSPTSSDGSETVPKVSYPNFSFDIIGSCKHSKARLGLLKTPHGSVQTPNFVFCATKAAMKATTPQNLRDEGTQIILSNTYHLMITPGSDIIEQMGGLQKFTGWKGPMLTDSGGYQIFSMGFGSVSSEIKGKRDTASMGWNQTLLKIDEQGATFRSYVDGTIHMLSPEKSVDIQRQLGADLIVVLDECTPFNVDKKYTEMSMRRSHRWAIRSLREFERTASGKQALYGIIQGGVYEDLRDESVEFINDHDFFGVAIGGSLGASKKEMHRIVAYTRSRIRNDRPIHLLGIGGTRDIFHGVRQGIDTFDCVHPTRLGRHGGALVLAAHWDEEPNPLGALAPTPMTNAAAVRMAKLKKKEEDRIRTRQTLLRKQSGISVDSDEEANANSFDVASNMILDSSTKSTAAVPSISKKTKLPPLPTVREHIQLDKGSNRNDPRPIDPTCKCYTCTNFSRAYLHHLFKAKEMLGGSLVTIHNIHFMNRLMADIRQGIANGNLDEVENRYVHPKLKESLKTDSLNMGS